MLQGSCTVSRPPGGRIWYLVMDINKRTMGGAPSTGKPASRALGSTLLPLHYCTGSGQMIIV